MAYGKSASTYDYIADYGGSLSDTAREKFIFGLRQAQAITVSEDARMLAEGFALPDFQEPPQPKPRRLRKRGTCWLAGILVGGFVAWAMTLIVFCAVFSSANAESGQTVFSGSDTISYALVLAVPAGFVGFVLFGIPLALIFQGSEVKARAVHQQARVEHVFWEDREDMRGRLESGELSVTKAISILRNEPQLPPRIREAAVALPTAGMPVEPRTIIALASAIVEREGRYLGFDEGHSSTASVVLCVLTDPQTVEREYLQIGWVDVASATKAIAWVLEVYNGAREDSYRARTAEWIVRPTLDPAQHAEGIRLVASVIGAHRRALAVGESF